MPDVKITPINQLKVKLECDSGINYEIAEHFSFFVDGYRFMPAFESGRWDGRIKLYDLKTKLFPRGLLPRLVEWLKENGYTIEIENRDDLKPKISFDPNWLEGWQGYSRLKPKPHQIKAITKCLQLNQALALSPTSCLDENTIIDVELDASGLEFVNELRVKSL